MTWKIRIRCRISLGRRIRGIVSDLCKQMIPLLKEADDPWYKEQILKELIPYGKE